MDLSNEIVFSLIGSNEQFPVDFEDAWQWIGYTRKDTAKSSILGAGFVEGTDFRIFRNIPENSKVGRPSEKIQMTVDCFKSFCMMAGTAKGREVRAYFLECEKELKRIAEEERSLRRERVVRAVVNEQHTAWEKRFEDNFFEEAYRITGWKKTKKGHPPCMAQLINKTIYAFFPDGVVDRLNEVNPVGVSGGRTRKQHQHLTPTMGLPILDYQKGVTIAVMRLSPSGQKKKFEENMQKACGNSVQVELPFLEDFRG